MKVLELGCGGANCGIALAKKGAHMTCIDISAEQLRFAKMNADRENVHISFIESPIEDIGYLEDQEYDKVISICALMYVNDIDIVFKEAYRVLKTGGTLCLA